MSHPNAIRMLTAPDKHPSMVLGGVLLFTT